MNVSVPAASVLALLLLGTGCTKKTGAPTIPIEGGTASAAAPAKTPPADDLVKKGRTAFMTNCTSCHNSDPRKAGTLGPEVFGASLELLEARILRSEYPTGYVPKRKSKVMVALPHLKGELSALHAYLNAP